MDTILSNRRAAGVEVSGDAGLSEITDHRAVKYRKAFQHLVFLIFTFFAIAVISIITSASNFFSSMEVLASNGGTLTAGGDPARGECHRFPLLEVGTESQKNQLVSASLGWVTSGVWRRQNSHDHLLLADAAFRRLARLEVVGLLSRGPTRILPEEATIPEEGTKDAHDIVMAAFLYPRADCGYLLLDQDQGDRPILFVNDNDQYESRITTNRTPVRDKFFGPVLLTGVFQMVPFGTGVLALTDIRLQEEQPGQETEQTWFAFLEPEEPEPKYSRVLDDPIPVETTKQYFLRDFQFIAADSSNTTAYVLLMNVDPEFPELWKIRFERNQEVTWHQLLDFPSYTLPRVYMGDDVRGHSRTLDWVFRMYRKIEKEPSPIPVGLMSADDRLFVLERNRSAAEPTSPVEWWLIEVDQENGAERRRLSVPTDASHLALVPGGSFVAAVEKGAVDVIGTFPNRRLYRPTETLLLYPTEWLDQGGQKRASEECTYIGLAKP
jgi:hypothetical protein